MAEQDFKAFSGAGSVLGKLAGQRFDHAAGKRVGRKSMPKITITIDEEFRLPDEFGGQRLEDEEDDFPLSDRRYTPMAVGGKIAKRALGKSKRAQRLEDEKKKKEKG